MKTKFKSKCSGQSLKVRTVSHLQIQILGIQATDLMAQALFCRHLQTCLGLQYILDLLRYQQKQCYHCTKGWFNNIFLTIEQMLPLYSSHYLTLSCEQHWRVLHNCLNFLELPSYSLKKSWFVADLLLFWVHLILCHCVWLCLIVLFTFWY